MTFLPIAERELRLASRRGTTYWRRVLVGLGALVFGAYLMLITSAMGFTGVAGLFALAQAAGLCALAGLFLGCRELADTLSAEKREGTLGLLFLTDLKGYDVVFGKLAAGGLKLLLGLLAAVPVLAIPILRGGVSAGAFWRTVLALLNTLFFACAVGIVVSAFARDRRWALGGATTVAVTFWFVLPALAALSQALRWPVWLGAVLTCSSPHNALATATNWTGGVQTVNGPRWWLSLGANHLLGWAFLGLACWWVPRSWQTRPAGVAKLRWRDRWQRWTLGNSAQRRARRECLLERGAFYWLAARNPWPARATWGVSFLLLALFFVAWWFERSATPSLTVIAAGLFHFILKLRLSGEATNTIAVNRRGQTLELLLSTPLRMRDILAGQWRALRRHFAGPLALALVPNLWLLFVWLGQRWLPWSPAAGLVNVQPEATAILLGSVVALVADVLALGWTGMWMAISQRNVNRADGEAVLRILVLPWTLLIIGFTLVGLARLALGRLPLNFGFWTYFVTWLVLGLANDVFFALWSRHQLFHRFRAKAGEPDETALPAWTRRAIHWLARTLPRPRSAAGG